MSDSDLTKRHALPGVMEEELELATKDESMGLWGEALLLLGEIEHEKMLYESEEKENKHFELPPSYEQRFFSFLHQINLRLMEDKDNFYGYFFIQMDKAIRFNLKSPSGVNFKNGKYVMYFNPFIFLNLTISQMESDIRHEILHIVSMHLERSKILRKEYSKLATNLAMDMVVNNYLSPLPPDAVTLAVVNANYGLHMLPFKTLEYYVAEIEAAMRVEAKKKKHEQGKKYNEIREGAEEISIAFDPESTHDIWDESDAVDEKTLQKLTESYVTSAEKGQESSYLAAMIKMLKDSSEVLPWYHFLKKLIGNIASGYKRTTMRRDRRQPERLELRGRLRNHTAKVVVAVDISGSISDGEFYQAMEQVLHIVKSYDHELIVVECDDEIRRTYSAKRMEDVKERMEVRGNTAFSPVVDYANKQGVDLLVYFTDGTGEKKLAVTPKYPILWVLTGDSVGLSVEKPYGLVKQMNPVKPVAEEDVYIRADGFSMNNQEGFSMANQERYK